MSLLFIPVNLGENLVCSDFCIHQTECLVHSNISSEDKNCYDFFISYEFAQIENKPIRFSYNSGNITNSNRIRNLCEVVDVTQQFIVLLQQINSSKCLHLKHFLVFRYPPPIFPVSSKDTVDRKWITHRILWNLIILSMSVTRLTGNNVHHWSIFIWKKKQLTYTVYVGVQMDYLNLTKSPQSRNPFHTPGIIVLFMLCCLHGRVLNVG